MKEINSDTIYVYSLHCNVGDRIVLLMEPLEQIIPIEEVIFFVYLIFGFLKFCVLVTSYTKCVIDLLFP